MQFEIGDEVKWLGDIDGVYKGIIIGGSYYDVRHGLGGFLKIKYDHLTKIEKPKYNKETIEALLGSVKKWEDIIFVTSRK